MVIIINLFIILGIVTLCGLKSSASEVIPVKVKISDYHQGTDGEWVDYDFVVSSAGNYLLSVRYAAAESRPVSIFLDGNPIIDNGLANTTGSWDLETGAWEDQGVLNLTVGKHTLKFQEKPSLPHITDFKLNPTEKVAEVPVLKKKKEFLEHLLQNIYQVLQPFQKTVEGIKISGQLSGLEDSLSRLDISVYTESTFQTMNLLEKQTADLRIALAGLRTEKLSGSKKKVVVWASNPVTKIFKDAVLPEGINIKDTKEVFIEACQNEYEPAQVCISSYDYRGPVQVKINPLIHTSGNFTIPTVDARFVGYVPVPENTPGRIDVLRKAPDKFPDPLILDKEVILEPRQTQPVWITVKVPGNALPGDYKGEIEIITKNGRDVILLHLKVYPIAIPETVNFWMGAWGGDTIFAEELGFKERPKTGIWSPGYKDYSPEYFAFLKEETLKNRYNHRARVFSDGPTWEPFVLTNISWKDGKYSYDFTLFDKFISVVEDSFHDQFRIIDCQIAGDEITKDERGLLSGNVAVYNADGSVNQEKSFYNVSTDDPRYLEFIGGFFRAMEDHLKKKGWLDKVYFKVFDEPSNELLPAFDRLGGYVSRVAPGIRQNATRANLLKKDYVNLCLVGTRPFRQYPQLSIEAIKRGQEVWDYNNYLNMIDLPLIHTRMMGWVDYLYGLTGYQHWAWCWNRDPWEQTLNKPWGPGGNFLVYLDKSRKKVVDSIRWEMFRETEEDYELLYLLEKAGGDSKSFCRQLVKSPNEYEKNPEKFYQIRHQVLTELTRLSKTK